ncbi:hypothetical protein CYANOKiyG1_52100 [Okeania sp. KiyG1]|nr:hypothetical protein CYANOKiyG1_52100 [Okeania sp. KiyG1]
MKRILPWVMSVLLAFTFLNISPSSAIAADNIVVNGSFETPEVEFVDFKRSIEGWDLSDGLAIEIDSKWVSKPFEGSQLVEMDSYSVTGIYQDIPTEAGKTYKLTFAFKGNPDTPESKLNVGWGDSIVANLSKTAADTEWETYTYELKATSTSTRLSFDNLDEISDGMGSYIDAVSVVEKSLAVIGEFGRISNLNHEIQTVSLSHNFTAPVVLALPPSFLGSHPVAVRLSNITSNSFDVRLQEPSNFDGTHTTETLSFIVLEAGQWKLDDGTVLEVGVHNTSTTVGRNLGSSSFDTVNFSSEFGASPVVFTELQTSNGPDFVYTRQQPATTDSFQVAMQEEEIKTDGHTEETIGWLAIEASDTGNWSGHKYQAQIVSGIQENFVNIGLSGYEEGPQLIAAIATYNGPDSAGLRYQNLTNNGVEIKIEEETSLDEETDHTTENVNILTIEGSGELQAAPAS